MNKWIWVIMWELMFYKYTLWHFLSQKAYVFKIRNNVIYTEKLIQIYKVFPMLLDHAFKIVFKNHIFYAPGIKDSTILGNKENKKHKEKLLLINLGDASVDQNNNDRSKDFHAQRRWASEQGTGLDRCLWPQTSDQPVEFAPWAPQASLSWLRHQGCGLTTGASINESGKKTWGK